MTIEIIVGAVVVIAVVAYFLLKGNKEEAPEVPVVVEAPSEVVEPEVVEPKAEKPKKATKAKKAVKVDLDSMKKDELLAHAKANGIKANASMNKAALIEAIKNG